MFALMRDDETSALLTAAGFGGIEIEAVTPQILLSGGMPADASADFLLGMGMVRGLLGRLEPDARNEPTNAVRRLLADRYEPGIGVGLGAAGWLVSATA